MDDEEDTKPSASKRQRGESSSEVVGPVTRGEADSREEHKESLPSQQEPQQVSGGPPSSLLNELIIRALLQQQQQHPLPTYNTHPHATVDPYTLLLQNLLATTIQPNQQISLASLALPTIISQPLSIAQLQPNDPIQNSTLLYSLLQRIMVPQATLQQLHALVAAPAAASWNSDGPAAVESLLATLLGMRNNAVNVPTGPLASSLSSASSAFNPSSTLPSVLSRGPEGSSQATAASSSTETSLSASSIGRVIPLSLPTDKDYVSEYQVLLREQIDLFEATEMDLTARAQGRNKPIQLNSVGIRCRHCASLHAGFRPRGAVYFPTKLIGLYHSSQNMAANHFSSGACTSTSSPAIQKLASLRDSRSIVYGRSSQRYWEQAAEKLGVREVDGRLVFAEDAAANVASVATSNDA
jgi:hypothetical protein